ncbi:MAG: response regulator [Spirochaetia bacterium]|nr:response regulator [Spirochaetia bacterium]
MARVLLVDDLKFIKQIERKALEESGHQIVGDAKNGLEAIQLYMEIKPDIVLMDITMPEVNGLEALKKILTFDPDAKVIICSALSHEKALYQAVKSGAKEYIVKPFTTERLISTLNKVLEQ